MENRMHSLEEQLAHLSRTTEELSEIVARQEQDIAQLTRRMHMLMEREAAREAAEGTSEIVADQRPPHW